MIIIPTMIYNKKSFIPSYYCDIIHNYFHWWQIWSHLFMSIGSAPGVNTWKLAAESVVVVQTAAYLLVAVWENYHAKLISLMSFLVQLDRPFSPNLNILCFWLDENLDRLTLSHRVVDIFIGMMVQSVHQLEQRCLSTSLCGSWADGTIDCILSSHSSVF